MKIGIIGAGFTGLTAAYRLSQKGHSVQVFERDSLPGGLAIGFEQKTWDWTLEKHYHHWFSNDMHVLNLANELHYPVVLKRPKTSVYVSDTIYQLDSPLKVLAFPKLNVFERVRMAAVLGFLRFDPLWQPLEKVNSAEFLPKAMGKKAYKLLWEPQLSNKFGSFAGDVSLAWFWARIKKRTSDLAYPEGGFLAFAKALDAQVVKQGGKIYYQTEVTRLNEEKSGVTLTVVDSKTKKKRTETFDKLIVTLPSFHFLKIAPKLPTSYEKKLKSLKGLGAINLVLRLKKPFFPDDTYWLSVCEKGAPIMAIVEHTNFMSKTHYHNEHLVYLGNYLPADHKYFSLSASELLKVYVPYLKKINPNFQENLIASHVFQAPFAQPIIPVNYSQQIPSLKTPLPNVFLANMQQVYPWDRGTNYAVELGEKVANLVTRD